MAAAFAIPLKHWNSRNPSNLFRKLISPNLYWAARWIFLCNTWSGRSWWDHCSLQWTIAIVICYCYPFIAIVICYCHPSTAIAIVICYWHPSTAIVICYWHPLTHCLYLSRWTCSCLGLLSCSYSQGTSQWQGFRWETSSSSFERTKKWEMTLAFNILSKLFLQARKFWMHRNRNCQMWNYWTRHYSLSLDNHLCFRLNSG